MSRHLAGDVLAGSRVHEHSDDKTVQTQDFSENENQDHANEESGLLSSTTDTSITNDTDGEASSKTSQTDGQTGAKLYEAREKWCLLLEVVGDQHRDDEAVDTNDTSHNDWNDVLDNQIRSKNTHGCNADTGLCGTICCTEAGEDNG